MCLILIAIDMHPTYPLIIAANRDEYYARPTRSLRWWPEDSQLLGGKDLESGGSWFGLNRSGYLAAVTNYREAGADQPQRLSRGILVRDYLQDSRRDWVDWQDKNSQSFNGFNLIYGYWNQLKWFSNRGQKLQALETGIHGLCNSLLNTTWPKVERGKALLGQAIAQNRVDPEDLLNLLHDDLHAPDNQLPDTGIGREWEHRLSSIFIRSASYGTRASTVLLIDQQQDVQIKERNWLPDGKFHDVCERFSFLPKT